MEPPGLSSIVRSQSGVSFFLPMIVVVTACFLLYNALICCGMPVFAIYPVNVL